MKSTQAMRDRIRELMNREQDDYDRAVECVLDDLEGILAQTPVAWRCRSTDEPDWNYGEKKLIAKDLFRKEPGFEEQPLFTPQQTSNK